MQLVKKKLILCEAHASHKLYEAHQCTSHCTILNKSWTNSWEISSLLYTMTSCVGPERMLDNNIERQREF